MSIFKKIPNPFGRKGGEEHQNMVNEVADDIDSRALDIAFERRIELSSGKSRYIDVAGLDNKEVVELHQIGKQTKKGLPVKRERDVIEEVLKETGIEIQFHPYNNKDNDEKQTN